MSQKSDRPRLPFVKFGGYSTEPLIKAFGEFNSGDTSLAIRGAKIAWMTLGADARQALERLAETEADIDKAVREAKRIVKRDIADQILLEHARAMPKEERMKIIAKER